MDYGIPNLVELIKKDVDFYGALASQVFMKPVDKIDREEKEAVKKDFLGWLINLHKEIIGEDI